MTQRKSFLIALLISTTLIGCKQADKQVVAEKQVENSKIDFTNPKDILAAVEAAHGGWNHLRSKNDVEYHYEYTVPQGKADISTERYLFDAEISFGHYTRHEINTMPNDGGIVTHLFDGEKTTLTLNGKTVVNEQTISVGQFVRRANYFWFVMPYKLNDPGTITKYLGKEAYNGIDYKKLEITYDAKVTEKEKNDIYILYINQETQLIDRFYFSLPFLGINAPVILAEYEYEAIEGQKIAVNRNYFLPDAKGAYVQSPSITQTLTHIKFNNGFTKENILSINK
ncbi:DUF6503 family protein [Maribacter sp. 2210JD10-5]|uniref:DUF6503 family protein n=1 Tax=Maribacter sp. 2210JD10-5 TaxID=3386272 RepID=UPI0039BCEC25